jgi:hypothetical protein
MLQDRVESLAERVARVSADDHSGHEALRCEMAVLAKEIHGLERPEIQGLARCLQAAAAMSLGLASLPASSQKEAEKLLLQTVLFVAQTLQDGTSGSGTASGKQGESTHLVHEMLLGELLMTLGVLGDEDVKKATEDQIWTRLKFGESVVRLGSATTEDVEDALELQKRARDRAAGFDPNANVDPIAAMRKAQALPPPELSGKRRIGEALYRLGRIDRRELDLALKLQRATGQPLGEALVEIGAASLEDVMDGLRFQKEERARLGQPS